LSFIPTEEGTYTLNFSAADTYDVEWDSYLNFSVEQTGNNPVDPNNPLDPVDPGNNNGGGGCSSFGSEILILTFTGFLIRKKTH
jgi:hypothetical protein